MAQAGHAIAVDPRQRGPAQLGHLGRREAVRQARVLVEEPDGRREEVASMGLKRVLLCDQFGLSVSNGMIHKDRTPNKQGWLRWPCPLPYDHAIPDLLQQ